MLLRIEHSPVTELNRTVALRYVLGPESALAEVERLAPALGSYHLWHAVRAELLRAQGRQMEAQCAESRALELTRNPAEQSLLRRRLNRQC